MLERVPATAESAAHLFLRSFERPCKSARVLDPKFWRHGVDDLDTAAWWPLYLQQVRQLAHPRHSSSEATAAKRWSRRNTSGGKEVREHQHRTPGTRPFTACASQKQRAQAQSKVYDVFGLEEDVGEQPDVDNAASENVWALRRKARQEQQEGLDTELVTSQPLLTGLPQQASSDLKPSHQAVSGYTSFDYAAPLASMVPPDMTEPDAFAPQVPQTEIATQKKKRLKNTLDLSDHNHMAFDELLRKDGEINGDDFDRAWRLFIAFDIQEKVAPYMFDFLIRSDRSSDLPRALEAFRLIPRDKRSERHYRGAVFLEQKRHQYHNAMNLAFEAAIKGFNVLPDILVYFVRNLLWNSTAELLYRNMTARRDMAAFAPEPQPDQGSKMLPDYELLKACEQVEALHLKVLSLAERLKSSNAELLEHKDLLTSCLKRLAVLCVESPTQMRSIPASGLLALFDLQKEFGILQLHEKALHTIFHLPNRKDKADLALMTYRNLRFSLPHDIVKRWMIGGLIGMCSEVNYPLEIYNYLLNEFEDHHKKPDEKAYQRVLTSCARQGNVDAVARTFVQYRRNYNKIQDLSWLSPLIYCHAVRGDAVNARKQFDRIKNEFGFEPNQTCWNMLMLAHARSNDDVSTFDVFDEMRRARIRPDSYTYGILLSVCGAHGDTETALELLSNARDDGSQITVPMANTVVETYLSHRDVQTAMRFAIATSESGTSEPLTRLWNSFIRYFAATGDIAALMNVRSLMSKYKVKADEMTYAAIMSALTLLHKTSEAVALLQEMHINQGLRATAFHYSIILHGFVKERNREMITVVANEMRQRFPQMSPSANRALLLFQSQRDEDTRGQNSHSVELLASILQDLYATSSVSPYFDQSFGIRQKSSAVASLYLETTIESMIRNGSYEDATRLLDHLQTFTNDNTNSSVRSLRFVLAKMDIAIARGDHPRLTSIWDQLFEHASQSLKPVRTIREQRESQKIKADVPSVQKAHSNAPSPGGSQSTNETPVLKAWRTSLSKPLNRYIEAMARQDRLDEMVDFVKRRFKGAGFTLTGVNWNKYIQVLCRSPSVNHHAHAFAMTETLMLNRAQSWTLLRRGLLRQKQTSYLFKAMGEHKRPVLQEQSSYSVAGRLNVLRSHPRRVVPTYTTMVHLGSVLLHAQRKVEEGSLGELETITQLGPKTKKFLQQMPYLKDSLQGELLRGLEKSSNPKPRPRSEQSFRESTNNSGILDSKSPLDYLPHEFLQDIKATVKPGSDTRYQLKGSLTPAKLHTSDEQDIQLGEKIYGKIAQDSIVLARKGRFETDSERTSRVKQEEKNMIRKVQALRDDLRLRELTREVYQRDLDPQVHRRQRGDPARSTLSTSKTRSLVPLPKLVGQYVPNSGPQSNLQDTLKDLSVRGQIKILKQLRESGSQGLSSSNGSLIVRRALPYAARRLIGRLRARKQHSEARRHLDMLDRENVSDRALQPRTAAGRRALLFEQARRRRRAYLQYEADIKAGKRLYPLPKTERGFWDRLAGQGPPDIRFVADLNRHPNRYLIRRGLMVEKRRPRIHPRDLNDRKFKVTTRHSRAMMKKKDKHALRRARKGLPPLLMTKTKPVAIGTRLGQESIASGEPYFPR